MATTVAPNVSKSLETERKSGRLQFTMETYPNLYDLPSSTSIAFAENSSEGVNFEV